MYALAILEIPDDSSGAVLLLKLKMLKANVSYIGAVRFDVATICMLVVVPAALVDSPLLQKVNFSKF